MTESDYINVMDYERLREAKRILRDVNLFDHPELQAQVKECLEIVNAARKELEEHINIDI